MAVATLAVGATTHELVALAASMPQPADVADIESLDEAVASSAPVVVAFPAAFEGALPEAVTRLGARGASVVVVMSSVDPSVHQVLTTAGATDVVTTGDVEEAHVASRFGVALRLAHAEAELRSMASAKAEAAQAVSDFSRLITHDVRGSMSTIGLACDVLRGALGEAPSAKYIDSIERALGRTGDMLDRMSDLIAIETGRSAMEPQSVDARDILANARKRLEDKAGKSGASLTSEAPEQPVMVRCDRARITAAVTNLAEIGLLYVRGGAIELVLEERDDAIVYSVVVPGFVIAAEHLPSLRGRAWRGPAGSGSLQPGAAFAVAVAGLHGGRLDIQPFDGGTRLNLVFPPRTESVPG